MKEILITLIVCVVIYEIVEHILLPFFWTVRYRGRKSAYGPLGMIGEKCVVKQWTGNCGKLWIMIKIAQTLRFQHRDVRIDHNL